MARKLILLALAAALGLAVTGVASARWFNVIRGTKGDDMVAGTVHRDLVLSFAGNDQITSAEGRDIVYAGRGNDTVDGGPQFDRIFGGPGDDALSAGDDGALIWGGYGNDTINAGNTGRNRLHGGPGNDTLNGGPQRDYLWGGRGVDNEYGAARRRPCTRSRPMASLNTSTAARRSRRRLVRAGGVGHDDQLRSSDRDGRLRLALRSAR
jgi:Ca2+-binding RTX toxin-like protein